MYEVQSVRTPRLGAPPSEIVITQGGFTVGGLASGAPRLIEGAALIDGRGLRGPGRWVRRQLRPAALIRLRELEDSSPRAALREARDMLQGPVAGGPVAGGAAQLREAGRPCFLELRGPGLPSRNYGGRISLGGWG